jgi:hypothetical protein
MGAKGKPKTGGRKKGSVNRNTIKFEEILANFDDGSGRLGFCPVTEALKLYTLIHADNPLVATKIVMGMMEYMYPKRRSVAMEGPIDFKPITLRIQGEKEIYELGGSGVSSEAGDGVEE